MGIMDPTSLHLRRSQGKPYNGGDSLLTANRADHLRMRQVLGHAFSNKVVREQEVTVEMYVQKLTPDSMRR